MGADVTREIDDGWKVAERAQPEDGEIDALAAITDAALADASSISSKRLLGQIFERELDEIHTPEGSSYFSEKREDRATEEKRGRNERYMMAAVVGAAKTQLEPHGLKVLNTDHDEAFGVVKDGEYVLRAKDSEGRRFEAKYGLALAERLVRDGGHSNLVARIGFAVAREILEARGRYLERAELPPGAA